VISCRRHLCGVYDVAAPDTSNSYAAVSILGPASGAQASADFQLSGAVINDHSDNKTESPYSTLRCILLLLATGIVVKTGAALHLCQLGSCN
jgi:hypothetical protein